VKMNLLMTVMAMDREVSLDDQASEARHLVACGVRSSRLLF
jgi:hypothetical protein